MTGPDVLIEAGRLAAAAEPFALATVVDVVRPASTRRGDRALIRADGSLLGWIGGACSEPAVVREALRAIADGEPRLLRIGPAGRVEEGAADDAVVVASACASEGVVEVLVEPQLAGPLLVVLGDGPAAGALARLADGVGWRVARAFDPRADAVVVATMGRGDEDALSAALAADVEYVGLVASARRAGAVVAELRRRGLDEEALARLRSPAGLDLGPCTQEEIAVAVLAELVAWRHRREPSAPPAEAVDPVCGMLVAIEPGALSADHEGTTYYFCSPHCHGRFEAEAERYVSLGA
jgi:xanthine dehydrogenase accessory factor